MSSYFIRVRLASSEIKPAIEQMLNYCEAGIAYEHGENAANVHCHVILVGCQVSTDTLKNYVKRICTVPARAGNQFWSFKAASEPLGAISYMSKGKYDPFVVKGYTHDVIESCKLKWEDRPAGRSGTQYQTRLQYVVRETASEAKKRKNDLVQEMISELADIPCSRMDGPVDERVIRIIVKVLNNNKVIFSRYAVRDYYDTIVARQFTESFVQNMVNFLSVR